LNARDIFAAGSLECILLNQHVLLWALWLLLRWTGFAGGNLLVFHVIHQLNSSSSERLQTTTWDITTTCCSCFMMGLSPAPAGTDGTAAAVTASTAAALIATGAAPSVSSGSG